MIREALLGAALVAIGVTTAAAEVTFTGQVKITAVTPQCQNVRVNDRATSRFHPRIPGNAAFAGLSWVFSNGALGHGLYTGNFDGVFRTVRTGGVGWGDPYFAPVAQQSQVRVISYAPAIGAINAATQTVTIRGQVRRPFNDPGGLACVATFLATYVKDGS